MKQFAAFSYANYYPGGGWCDFAGTFDTLEEAKQHGRQVVDLHTGKVVYGDPE